MKIAFQKYFIPNADNNYRPHILHSKRAIMYSLLAIAIKAIVVVFAISIPSQAYLLPDILESETANIEKLTNAVRNDAGLPPLTVVPILTESATIKASDMANKHYFSHRSPTGVGLSDIMKSVKYPYRVAGENLAMGFNDASAVVSAWIKSPTHYANLVDKDFTEIGVALVGGEYQNQPTVFVAEHFGDPKKRLPLPNTTSTVSASTTASAIIAGPARVLGTKISSDPSPVEINDDNSRVTWQDLGDDTLKISVVADIIGPVKKVDAYINGYNIQLSNTGGSIYSGETTVFENSNDFFKTIILPTLQISTSDGSIIRDVIAWENPKIVAVGPIAKYLRARDTLAPITNLFNISRGMYLGIILFFSFALFLNIFIEIKRQHYETIAQTAFMIGFIALLWWV